jgi:flagellar biosynthetic protein FliQ
MNVNEATLLMQETLKLALMLAAPMLLMGLGAGILIAIFQAVTSIHEMTLTFIPKILAIVVGLFLFLPWMVQKLLIFATGIFLRVQT